jgi:predicted nucleic acid-binding protein
VQITALSLDDYSLARLLDTVLEPTRAMLQRLQPEVLLLPQLDAELVVPLDFSEADHARIGERLVRMYMVTSYPHSPTDGWIDELYQWHANVSMAQHLEPAHAGRLIRDLNNTIKESEARLAGHLTHDKRKVEEQRIEDADRLIRELAVGNHRVIDFSMTFV